MLGIPDALTTTVVNENQTRALAAVPGEKRVEVLTKVVKTGKVTAKRITAAAKREPITITVEPEPKKSEKARHCETCTCPR